MAAKTLNVKVLNVAKTTAQWADETSVISKGLLCVEFTTDGKTYVKIGDGVKTYDQLPYIVDGSFSIENFYNKEETEEYVDSAIQALGNIIHIKGVKATVEELPTEGNEIGDMYFVGTPAEGQADSFAEYVWTAEQTWEFIGRANATVDLTDYAKTSYVDGLVQNINERLDAIEEALGEVNVVDLEERVQTIEDDYIKSTDDLTLNCQL